MELTPEQQEALDKKKLPLQIADRLRLIFLFLAFMLLAIGAKVVFTARYNHYVKSL